MRKKRPAVFLDRDGTLIEEIGYLKNPEDINFIGNSPKAIKQLNMHNILTVLITNQSGVARGYFTENDVEKVNEELKKKLKTDNAYLDGIYYCPHHEKGSIDKYSIECSCRKPKTGLIQQALRDFEDIDIAGSYVIGDKVIDIELAKNAGCKGILVKTGYGSKVAESLNPNSMPDHISNDLSDAVNWILKDLKIYK